MPLGGLVAFLVSTSSFLFLVIIYIINIMHVPIFKPENDPPIARHIHRVKAFQVAR